ncbi:MAG: ABC transporter ATP-binding protein [Bdellovibrionaceae bacterium]|nr:ABC transporter ATP-binding protein [Pseudobdellovibrionaceae bacterium]MBX3033576.1 ABC transporter ATP-binding protein [Pseudobdellovibrionaceae bacterium]
MKPKAFELRRVGVAFDGRSVLRDVTLDVGEGECLVLIGPSGQGKTTLLKTMAGLIAPQDGEITVRNQNFLKMDATERLNLLKRMGMLFQRNALFDSMTCAENVAFPLRETTDGDEAWIGDKVEQFLEAVGLSQARDLYPDEISGGMQKRLGIARALALSPEIIFYDDPTAGLDPITSRKIVELIQRLRHEQNSTVIAVTNDMNRAYQMADRLALVADGGVLVTGSVEETKRHPDPRVRQFIHGSVEGPLSPVSGGG